MGDKSGIEWTDATWNPVTGCTKVSPGCDHCYAETIATRFGSPVYPRGFEVTLREHKLDQPLRWQRSRMVFVNSMSDVFHQDISDEYVASIFAVMTLARQHTFQVLTKRHARMRALLAAPRFIELVRDDARISQGFPEFEWPLPNVWLGVSTEDQKWADTRIPFLAETPAAVRFISAEPLLGPIDLAADHLAALNWVIVGGESGAHARPMDAAWVRSLRDQATGAGIAFHFKQWSGRQPKKLGRELDGRTWDEKPPLYTPDAAQSG